MFAKLLSVIALFALLLFAGGSGADASPKQPPPGMPPYAPPAAAGACREAIYVPFPAQHSSTACSVSEAVIVIPYTAPQGTAHYVANVTASGSGRIALTVNGATAFVDVPPQPVPLTITLDYSGAANYVNVTAITNACPASPVVLDGLRLYSSP